MAKNDLTLLESILSSYISNEIPSSKPDEVFEYFSSEQVLKDFAFSKEELLNGSVDGRNDGGIDAFYIIVNGHLAESIPLDFWPKSNVQLEVYLFTCKHDDSFKQAPITTMIPSLIELFDFSIPSSSFSAYNEKLLKKRDLLITTYKRLAPSLSLFNLHIIYSCRGTEEIEENIQAKADQAIDICSDSFSGCSVSFEFWGNRKLLDRYREQPNSVEELRFNQCINQDGQYIVLSSLKNYYEFIVDANGNLNKRLFDANVRDYLGLNPVNADIQKSLANTNGPDFWWLNNGITIIGSKAHLVGNIITISDVQIVNGLQTSESIFNYFSGRIIGKPAEPDNRSVLIKVLISSSKETNDDIIFATNNQTNVNVTALRATDRIQIDIEEILKTNQIYYDRKTNYYQNQGMPESAIITPLAIAGGLISLIYKNPYLATSLKQKFMRNTLKYQKVFSPSFDINVWVAIASLLLKTDRYLGELKPNISGNLFRLHKNFKHITMFVTVSRLMGSFAFGEKDLVSFDIERYTCAEVAISISDLLEVDSDCFARTKKPQASFYTAVFNHIAKKYNISSIQAIQAKNKLLWAGLPILESFNLDDETIEQVFTQLPPQPWPVNIHKAIATKLGISEQRASEAISYLTYIGRVYYQIYGFVMDNEGTLISESQHFGRSITEARAKQKEISGYYSRRYEF